MVEAMGIDHVGAGGDFDGSGGVEGTNDAGEMHNLTVEMLRRGYTKEVLEIFSEGGDDMPVLDECQRIAAELSPEADQSDT